MSESSDPNRSPAAWPEGCDGRALRNDLTDRWERGPVGPAERERLAERYRRAPSDDYSIKALWAGEGLDLIHAIEPAEAIIARVVGDALHLLRTAPTGFGSVARP